MTREDFQYELEALHNEAMRIIHVGHLPSPRLVSVKQSLINYDKENREAK